MFLTKLEVNNQIVRMRHNVRRAKVQTLNKLSRQMKKISGKNCSSELKLKNDKKISKLLTELLTMKKIKEDEIAAFALVNTRNPQHILSDENSSSKLKALSRLSTHKSVAPVVNSFRLKHPDWQSSFPKVLVALKTGKKLKFDFKNFSKELRRRDKNECKTGREAITFNTEIQCDESAEENEKDEDYPGAIIKISDIVASRKVNNSSSNERHTNSSDVSSNESISAESDIAEEDNDANSSLKHSGNHNPDDKLYTNKNIFEITKMSDEISLPPYRCNTEDIIKEETLTKKPVSRDPFFVTSDGKEYETIVPVNHGSVENKVKNCNIFSESVRHIPTKFNEKLKCDNKMKIKNNFKKQRNKNFDDAKLNVSTKLHPSWAAKKQQNLIKSFTGKKIIFD